MLRLWRHSKHTEEGVGGNNEVNESLAVAGYKKRLPAASMKKSKPFTTTIDTHIHTYIHIYKYICLYININNGK